MTLDYFAAKKKLTQDIQQTVRERPELSFEQIAEHFGVPHYLVKYRAKLAGIKRRAGRKKGGR